MALAAAACGSLHEAVVEVEVPAAVVESSRRWPEAARAVVAQLRAILQNDHGPALSCFRANGGVLLRRGAARACALLQDPPSSVIQACLALACDSDSVVRANAADALAPGLSPAAAVVTVAAEFKGVVPVKAKALLARRSWPRTRPCAAGQQAACTCRPCASVSNSGFRTQASGCWQVCCVTAALARSLQLLSLTAEPRV